MSEKEKDVKSSFCRVIVVKLKNDKDWSGPVEYIVGKTNTTIGRDFYLDFDLLD